jgi:cell division protein FtsQ
MTGTRKQGGAGQDRRFMRGSLPRWLSTRRRRRRQLATGTILVLLTAASAVLGWTAGAMALQALRASPAFAVVDLDISPCTRLDTGELSILYQALARHSNIFSLHLGRMARDVEKHRWVESCSIRRELPGCLRVNIVEKTPAVLARHGNDLLLLDREGVVIEAPPASQDWAGRLPLITGFDDETPWEAHRGRVRRAMPLVDLLAGLEQARAIPRVAEVDAGATDGIRIFFAGRDYPVLVDGVAYADQLARYRLLENTLEERHGDNLRYVDLRFRDRVIVKPAEGRGEEGRS